MVKKLKKYLLICAFILLSMLIGFFINLVTMNRDQKVNIYQEPDNLEQYTNYLKLEETYLYDPAHDKIYGVAKRAYQNGLFTLTIEADLSLASDTKNFQVYLGKPDTKESLKVGKIVQSNNRNFIIFEKNEDLSGYSSVFIMKRQSNGSDSLCLEGKFN